MRSYKIVEGECSLQGSESWLQFRRDRIGASDAAAVLGVSPWMTRLQLFSSKIEGTSTPSNPAMQRGTRLEPKARDFVNQIMKSNYQPALIQSLKYPGLIASLDGYWEKEDGTIHILEIKVPGIASHTLALEGTIPENYIPQLDHQLLVSGLDSVIYFSFDGENGTFLKHSRDEKRISELLAVELKFLSDLNEFRPPEPSDMDWVEKYDLNSLALSHRYKVISQMISDLEDEKEELKEQMIEGLNHPKVKIGKVCIQKTMRKGNYDVEKIIEKYLVLDAEDFRKPSSESWRITFE